MDNGNRRAPVTLAGNEPIAQTVVYFFSASADSGDIGGNFRARLFAEQSVELLGVDNGAVLAVGEFCAAPVLFDDLHDGEVVL